MKKFIKYLVLLTIIFTLIASISFIIFEMREVSRLLSLDFPKLPQNYENYPAWDLLFGTINNIQKIAINFLARFIHPIIHFFGA